jgi:hypothetical protein
MWVWEYRNAFTEGLRIEESFESLEELKAKIDGCFSDYRFEEVERDGVWGTAILVSRYGGDWNSGHWIYRDPPVLARPVCPRRPRPRAAWRG